MFAKEGAIMKSVVQTKPTDTEGQIRRARARREDKLWKFTTLAWKWCCLYLAIGIIGFDFFIYLKYGHYLELKTGKILPGLQYAVLSRISWIGVREIVARIFNLPIYIILPLCNGIIIFFLFGIVLGIIDTPRKQDKKGQP